MSNTRLRVGVVGAGAMGAAHARTLATSVPGAEVVRVFDMDTERAKQVAHGVGAEALKRSVKFSSPLNPIKVLFELISQTSLFDFVAFFSGR